MRPLSRRNIEQMVARLVRVEARNQLKILAEEERENKERGYGLDESPIDVADRLALLRTIPQSDGREPTMLRPRIGRWFRGPSLEPIPSDDAAVAWAVRQTATRYGKITGLCLTTGAAWTLTGAGCGVVWPFYATANPCDSAGTAVDTDTTIYLRFPAALSVDITTKGGPGVCGHAAGDVVDYALSDGRTAAGDGTVMNGNILAHSLKVKVHLPILATEADNELQERFWHSAEEPDAVFHYTTGWQLYAAGDYCLKGVGAGEAPGDVGSGDGTLVVAAAGHESVQSGDCVGTENMTKGASPDTLVANQHHYHDTVGAPTHGGQSFTLKDKILWRAVGMIRWAGFP